MKLNSREGRAHRMDVSNELGNVTRLGPTVVHSGYSSILQE